MTFADPRRFSTDEADALIEYTIRVTGLRPDDMAQRRREVRELGQGRALTLAAVRWAKAHGEILFLRGYAGPVDRALVERVHTEYDQACAALVEQTASIAGHPAPEVEGDGCTCLTGRNGRIPEVSCPVHRPVASADTTEIPAVRPAPRPRRRLPVRAVLGFALIALAVVLNLAGGRIG